MVVRSLSSSNPSNIYGQPPPFCPNQAATPQQKIAVPIIIWQTPLTVYHNTVTDLWIVTINTNSKLTNPIGNPNFNSINNSSNNNFTVKAFSFRTEKEARASAYTNVSPIMVSFNSCHECMLYNTKLTLFKRPRHCCNCGICICSNYDCCTIWSRKMIPETFNIKKETTAIRVCTSCHALSKRFRHALLQVVAGRVWKFREDIFDGEYQPEGAICVQETE